mmetsp:Transcript_4822/g.14618  ORF Transcript_4822/g.14618 Transcript_4822/m.14618 type:complete len:102 (+) Transcript_4822:2512-2817(+)
MGSVGTDATCAASMITALAAPRSPLPRSRRDKSLAADFDPKIAAPGCLVLSGELAPSVLLLLGTDFLLLPGATFEPPLDEFTRALLIKGCGSEIKVCLPVA